MAQWLNEQTVLSEDLSLSPTIHTGQLTTSYNSSFRLSDTSFWPPWAPAYLYTQTHTHTHIIKNKS